MAGQLVLKSQNAVDNIIDLPDINFYINRVVADGGIIYDMNALLDVFSFIYANGISEGEVFSAVNPAWGIKYDAGTKNVTKLYSLFDPVGDLEVKATSLPIKLDTTTYPFPSVYLGGSNGTYLKSLGLASNVENVGSAYAIVIPSLNDYGIGAGTAFPVNVLWSAKNYGETGGGGSVTPYVAYSNIVQRPDTSNNTPAQWWQVYTAFGGTGTLGSSGSTLYQSARPFGAFFGPNNGKLFNNGTQLLTDSTVTVGPNQKNNLELRLGGTVTNGGIAGSSYLLGSVIENWAMVNTSEEHMSAISKRINDKYYSNLPH
ncbi:hypothetical protein OHW20_02480 [Acinetobacter baumannii]|nr:hypothetical protein [Acinetobacter baumannii]